MTKKIKNTLINIAFYISVTITIIIFIKIFVLSSFKIPSNSMQPTIIQGDYILVNKAIYGARLFDVFDALDHKKVKIYRMPAFGKIKRNDIIVFHFPYPRTFGKIEMDMLKYYIKRCVALPGDTFYIQNCFNFVNNNSKDTLGNIAAQKKLQNINDSLLIKRHLYYTYPKDSITKWNIKNFGGLYIPKKGDTIKLTPLNIKLYHKIIAWEKNKRLIIKNDTLKEGNVALQNYIFKHNYYFVAGDNIVGSQDSRYWGLLPDEYIVGKAWLIWKSINPYTQEYVTDRFFKKL